MVLAEHGLDLNGVRVSLSFLCPACQIFSLSLGPGWPRRCITARTHYSSRAYASFSSWLLPALTNLPIFFGRWIRIFPKSSQDRYPSTSRVACRSTLRPVYVTGCAPALPVHYSSRILSSLAKAERGIIGRKAVRLFLCSLLFFSLIFALRSCPSSLH